MAEKLNLKSGVERKGIGERICIPFATVCSPSPELHSNVKIMCSLKTNSCQYEFHPKILGKIFTTVSLSVYSTPFQVLNYAILKIIINLSFSSEA